MLPRRRCLGSTARVMGWRVQPCVLQRDCLGQLWRCRAGLDLRLVDHLQLQALDGDGHRIGGERLRLEPKVVTSSRGGAKEGGEEQPGRLKLLRGVVRKWRGEKEGADAEAQRDVRLQLVVSADLR